MSVLVSSDWHLTKDPIDSYRWGLFPWIEQQIPVYDIEHILILGDLTMAKDGHRSELVNRVVDSLASLAKRVKFIVIICGNHDRIEKSEPFFRFLNKISNLQFLIYPTSLHVSQAGEKCLFLPNSSQPSVDWSGMNFNRYDFIFAHQTFNGGLSENGTYLEGVSPNIFGETKATIISGDLHVPQVLGKIIYCGAPYRIHFGDKFVPRLLLLRNGSIENLHFVTVQRHTLDISSPDELYTTQNINPLDQIKVRLHLNSAEFGNWTLFNNQIEEYCNMKQIQLCKVEPIKTDNQELEKAKSYVVNSSPTEILKEFVQSAKIDSALEKSAEAILSTVQKR